jgi:hypothetical protein
VCLTAGTLVGLAWLAVPPGRTPLFCARTLGRVWGSVVVPAGAELRRWADEGVCPYAGGLLSYAEGAEDEVEDVVGSGGAGDFVEGAKGGVEIEEEHLVGDAGGYGVGSG